LRRLYDFRWYKEEERQGQRILDIIERTAIPSGIAVSASSAVVAKERELRISKLSTTYKYLLIRALEDDRAYEITNSAFGNAEIAVRVLHERSAEPAV
jgi:hypothetical protein